MFWYRLRYALSSQSRLLPTFSLCWTEARQLAPYFSTKPPDAPVKKDNAYGYGLPAMGTMLGQVSQVSAPSGDMTSAMNMLVMMTTMFNMLQGVV